MRPFSIRSPSFERSAGSTVSEPSTDVATTRIGAHGDAAEVAVPAKNMPGDGDHHGQAGDEHRAAGRCGGGAERRFCGAPAARSSRSRRM